MLLGCFEIEALNQQLVLDSSLSKIDAVETLLSGLKREYSVSEEVYADMWVVLNEAVTNAIRHGNRFDSRKKVQLTVEIRSERYVCFTVKDEGAGFDHTQVPDPTSPERIAEPNGRGVFLIKKLSDRVKFLRKGTMIEIWFDLFKN